MTMTHFLFFAGLRLLWDGVSFLEMTVPPKYRNSLCGLCGNFNGDKSDDIESISGQQFGDSWRVGGLRACSVLPKDMPQSYQPQCTQSWDSRIKSDQFCNALKSSIFQKCNVDPEYYFNACKLDMCECPGEQCHCEVLTAYARECERSGVMVYNWREATNCKNVSSFKYSDRHHLNEVLQKDFPVFENSEKIGQNSTSNFHKLQLSQGTGQFPAAQNSTSHKDRISQPKFPVSTTESPQMSTTKLPDWILGPYLPGCSKHTKKFCQNRRKNRRKNKARKRRKRRRKLRRQRKKQKRLFKMGGVQLRKQNKKFEWSSIFGDGKRPPFETLLNSEEDETNFSTTEKTIKTHFDASKFKEISSSDLNKGRQRTPLPLKEAQEEWKRRKRK